MSDSQRMSGNNDGMNPDWKPAYSEPLKSEPLEKLKDLIRAIKPIAEAAREVPNEDNPSGPTTINWFNISASSAVWNKISKAYDEVSFK